MTRSHKQIVDKVRSRILELSTLIHLSTAEQDKDRLHDYIMELRDQARRLKVVLSPYEVLTSKAV